LAGNSFSVNIIHLSDIHVTKSLEVESKGSVLPASNPPTGYNLPDLTIYFSEISINTLLLSSFKDSK
jgi:hypothetical protein